MRLKRSKVLLISLILLIIIVMLLFTSCKAYDEPEYVTIEASQTAFLVPLVGDTTQQDVFASEELLAQAMVATKQVQIPHMWVQTGHNAIDGYWKPTMRLIVVERKPETRQWTSISGAGTTAKNEGIGAESKEQVGFTAFMNCSAQIDAENAAKFLYRYNNKPLQEIMDTEIRPRIETIFVEQCSQLMMVDIPNRKEEIMKAVREEVIPYFNDRGITITLIGLKDGLYFDNREIQAAIDDKVMSANLLITQQNENLVLISKAEADAEALLIASNAEAAANAIRANSLTPQLIQYILAQQWNGEYPQVYGSNGTLIQLPIKD